MEKQIKTQIVKCRCGSTIAACIEPDCYIDKDWLNDLKRYIKRGCAVEMVGLKKFNLEKCRCGEQQTNLF
jgi:hypothetical protein